MQHLEAIARLGATVASEDRLVARNVGEHRDQIRIQAHREEDVFKAFQAVAAKFKSGAAMRADRHQEPASEPFDEWLAQHIFDDAMRVGQDHGIVNSLDWETELSSLANFMAGPPERSIGNLLECLDSTDAKYWRLPSPWNDALLARADALSAGNVLLGLHELHRMPWSPFGGMVAGRGATKEYLDALQGLNRHVVVALIVQEWHFNADECVRWFETSVNDLVELSVPYQLPLQLEELLCALSRLYQEREFASAVVVARAALDSITSYASERLNAPPSTKLQERIEQLRRNGAFSAVAAGLAHDLRIRGNKALHEDLRTYNSPRQALDAIRLVVGILVALRCHLEVK